MLRLFPSDIQDGRHGGHLEILQMTSPPRPKVGLSQNLMGCISDRDSELQKCLAKSVYPDQMPQNVASDLSMHFLLRPVCLSTSAKSVKHWFVLKRTFVCQF